ncbi:MAG TPA: sterol desaturase family protein [Gammaproteobacteria bacterium]|nr:sterol desaturase family protein [Gammaproteobacteria bacterium]
MSETLLANEPMVRLGFFFGIFMLMALWELFWPRRDRGIGRRSRWPSNIAVVVIDTAVLRLLFPTAAVGTALFAESRALGVFSLLQWPHWITVVIGVVLLDLAIYLQHVMFHAVPAFWRLHRMHHADLDIDVTTGVRFHPIEIVLSMLIKLGVILMLGPPAASVLIFEVLLNATSMFNHSNAYIPPPIDRVLRLFVVTPDMHRVHHSVEDYETNSNFGFNLPWWDRLFGTYRAQPRAGHDGMTIGLNSFRDERTCVNIKGMLMIPFRGRSEDYVINRRSHGPRDGAG